MGQGPSSQGGRPSGANSFNFGLLSDENKDESKRGNGQPFGASFPDLSMGLLGSQNPMHSFNQQGMFGVPKEFFGGNLASPAHSDIQLGEDASGDGPFSERAASRRSQSHHSQSHHEDEDEDEDEGEGGEDGFKTHAPADQRLQPMSALKRSTMKLSEFMTPEQIAQLQEQEQQRAHDLQRRAIEKSFAERNKNKGKLSEEQQRLREAIQHAKTTAFTTQEYLTHSSYMFEGYNAYKNRKTTGGK